MISEDTSWRHGDAAPSSRCAVRGRVRDRWPDRERGVVRPGSALRHDALPRLRYVRGGSRGGGDVDVSQRGGVGSRGHEQGGRRGLGTMGERGRSHDTRDELQE
jgi:hypothetical protein